MIFRAAMKDATLDAKYGVRHKIHEVEATSDVETQALINQICADV